jgi:hypothetical protein
MSKTLSVRAVDGLVVLAPTIDGFELLIPLTPQIARDLAAQLIDCAAAADPAGHQAAINTVAHQMVAQLEFMASPDGVGPDH